MIEYFIFSTKDANQYGVDGAIMLHHLRYWVAKNEANETNFHDGQYWTYNSTIAFAKLFPFYSARKIGRILSKLEQENAIISGNFNGKRYDRTKWFTLVNAITENGMLHLTKRVNAITETVEPIPKYNHITTQSTNKGDLVMPFDSSKFQKFWGIWKDYKKLEHKFAYKSQIAEQAALKHLNKISNNNEAKSIELIEYAIAHGWKGIFPTKERNADKKFDSDEYSAYIDTL